jgi:hypothetical protein
VRRPQFHFSDYRVVRGCGRQRGKEAIRLGKRVADCPKCGSPARPAGNTAYCPVCEWNRLAAAEDIRQSLLVLPLVFLAFFVFSLLTRRWLGILVISGLSCLWTVGSGLKLALQRRELRRTGLTSPIAGSATVAQVERARDDGYVAPSRFSHFSTLAVPRKLTMKPVFRWLAILLSVIGLTFTDVSYSLLPPHKAPDDPHWGLRLGFITLAIYGALFGGWWLERRRKRLLRSGLVRFALVLKSNAGRGVLLPGITYRFLTENGKQIEDFDQDWTDSYHQGMVVPVSTTQPCLRIMSRCVPVSTM